MKFMLSVSENQVDSVRIKKLPIPMSPQVTCHGENQNLKDFPPAQTVNKDRLIILAAQRAACAL